VIQDKAGYKTLWTIHKYADDEAYAADKPFEVSEIEGNLLLNEGIAELLLLLTGGAGTAYSNANAYLGVGESSTAEGASDTDLIGASKTYKAMEATYPQISAQTVTFRSVFASGDANNAWEEFTVSNTSSGTGDNLNRKTSSQGTKVVGQTWTLDLAITFS
jgi:hypothetical protein